MMRRPRNARDWPRKVPFRDVSLYVDVVEQGDPLMLMHGGPSADLWTMGAFRRCADQFTLRTFLAAKAASA
jgi:proline iminopeptidase